MLDRLIRFSLNNRALVCAVAILLVVLGVNALRQLPVDVLPDITRPTVTLLTESPGLAPEEVEARVTLPIESALQGVTGIYRLRSSSDVGLSLIFAEFDWGTDIYRARQLVQERLQLAESQLPAGVQTSMAPVSSLMGEILLIGVRSKDGKIAPMDVRTLADWTIRQRLRSIPGVAEVLTIGGGVKQYQILPDPVRMAAQGVSFEELEKAASNAASTTTSGYMVSADREIMVRNLGMTTSLEDVGQTVVKSAGDRPITIRDVAELRFGPQIMRGDAGVNGYPGVILSVDKQPGWDTIKLTATIEKALEELRPSLPSGVEMTVLFRQAEFIEAAIHNLTEAIRDGAIMVALVLVLFLLNARTTLITLTAIPMSFVVTLLVFRWFGLGVNSMTLGGFAVAIGMVVDDAIVDVENVFRRLRENRHATSPKSTIEVVASASNEVRSSILYATVLVILVFIPLLGLEGIEGRLFAPIAIATMVSMAASFAVSLTLIPVLCSLLLPSMKRMQEEKDGFIVRALKNASQRTLLPLAFNRPGPVLGFTALAVVACLSLWPRMGVEFLPTFNEGSAIISMVSAPGSSLEASNRIGQRGEQLLLEIPEIKSVGRRTGRAEKDDHVMGVNVVEYDIEFKPDGRKRTEVLADIRERLATIPGVFVNVGQPISHRLSHMLSGVSAKIAIKIFGPDIDRLQSLGQQLQKIVQETPGTTDVNLEKQMMIPQVRIEVDRDKARAYGIQPGALNTQLSELLGGITVGEIRDGNRNFDVFLRLPESVRDRPEKLGSILIESGNAGLIPLSLVAKVREGRGPNVINRDNAARRIVVSANTTERDLGGIVEKLQRAVAEKLQLPQGYYVSFQGEYEAQREAAARIGLLSAMVFVVIVFLLYGYFRSGMLVAQVLINVPFAFAGGLFLTWLLVGSISIATLVGLITLAGIASRNTIMMIAHYLHLMRHEGEGFTREMVTRGSLERLVPVLMTALSAGLALVPLCLAAGAPGKEILHPVAVVIVGGLISSTLLDCIVTPCMFWHFGRRGAERSLALNAPVCRN